MIVGMTYTHACAICEKKHIENIFLHDDSVIPKPSIPEQWSKLPNGQLVCDNHNIKCLVDGKEVYSRETQPR